MTAALIAMTVTAPARGALGSDDPQEPGKDPWAIPAVALDLIVLRPLGGAACLMGFAFFVASTPLVAPSREIGTSWDVFVRGPVDYTFLRPLGDF